MPFHFPNQPPDTHGLAFYFDGMTGDFAAFPLTPAKKDIAAEIAILRKSDATCPDPISEVGPEAIALSVQFHQLERAAMFAQALHEHTGNRFFLIYRTHKAGRGFGWCEATFIALPIETLGQAREWCSFITMCLAKTSSDAEFSDGAR